MTAVSKSLADIQQTLAIALNALRVADGIVFASPGNGGSSVIVAQARDLVKVAVCELEAMKKDSVIVSKELLAQHIAEIDEWNASMTAVVGHDPDYFWHSLESLRKYV